MPRRARSLVAPVTAALVVALAAAPARAQDGARDAYQRAAAAFDAGKYDEAATGFARADELSPNPVALESAIRAATLGDEAALALELCDRADGRPANAALTRTVQRARERFASRAGKLTVRCRPGETCTLRVDGQPAEPGKTRWVLAGDRSVEVEVDGEREPFTVAVGTGATVGWEPPPRPRKPVTLGPPPPPPPPPPPGDAAPADAGADSDGGASRGISPAFFFIGAGAALVAGGVTVWSGVDTLDRHGKWDDGDDSARSGGEDAQLRTNVLLGVTGALAIGTAAIGIWAVDWGGGSGATPKSARVSVLPGGVRATFRY